MQIRCRALLLNLGQHPDVLDMIAGLCVAATILWSCPPILRNKTEYIAIEERRGSDECIPVKNCSSPMANTAQTDCWCPFKSYASLKFFQTLAVL